jgi:hypothetical protein
VLLHIVGVLTLGLLWLVPLLLGKLTRRRPAIVIPLPEVHKEPAPLGNGAAHAQVGQAFEPDEDRMSGSKA